MTSNPSQVVVDSADNLIPDRISRPMTHLHRIVAAAAGVVLLALSTAATAYADPPPPDPQPNPYPDLTFYDQLDADAFTMPNNDGVWFLSPTGQNCGIWGWGSFGCAGLIPGAPPGTTHIGWIDGDRAVHYDWSVGVRFPGPQAQQPLPPHSFIKWEGTTCAVTRDSRTYCERGPLRFVIEPTKTWLSAPWMDPSWVTLGPA